MKFLTRRKKKEKNDPDLYQPPDLNIDTTNNNNAPQHHPQPPDHSSYRYALSAYASTISPLQANEDGFGSSGTLRSRSTKSGGKTHKTLIPVFPPTPSSSEGSYGVEMDRYTFLFDPMNESVEARGNEWAPIPEEPRSPGDISENCLEENAENAMDEDNEVGQEQIIGQSSSEATSEQSRQRSNTTGISTPITTATTSSGSINFQTNYQPLHNNSPSPSSLQSRFPSQTKEAPRISTKDHPPNNNTLILQPDAIYEEHYGDGYIDQHIKYLYPSGYTSMRPRSGPWKLSIFISALFLWLSVFIVGHCYDRGQEYNYFGYDDAYLQDVDDDTLVMVTRWCGSKLIYFMWFVCVSITMLAMSYCSIIGYIKLRDVVVANGRSQPAGSLGGRNDCYANIENVGYDHAGDEDRASIVSCASTGYSSYQEGGVGKRYPSIYQSDGTPQFWGGHIYRPTQAAVSMTNR
jgi:hypothetical protein